MALPLALLVSVLIAALGWRLQALTAAGAATASVIGTAILGGTGWAGLATLGIFFAGASAISRAAPDRPSALDAKGSVRDAAQVLANGGPAALGALVPGAGLWIVAASLAAAAADTWATSMGGWSRSSPRHILTWRGVPAGTSGGVTLLGTIGALIGAVTVAGGAALVTGSVRLLAAAIALGMLGMLADSVLGATLQGRFHCDDCGLATERRTHRCGGLSRLTAGIAWVDNDGVNALATTLAAIAGYLAWRAWGP
ncbi:MAG TPA: DUF92 domain-containing protein [Gemmatimonadales bacterium]|nr:DUF92 domain-containing protein [Gemmatimonadales bacterium]